MGKDIKDLDALLDDDDVSSTGSEENTPVVEDSLKNHLIKTYKIKAKKLMKREKKIK